MAGVDGFEVFIEQMGRVERLIDEKNLKVKIGIYFRTYKKEELLKSEIYEKLSKRFYIEEVGDSFFSWFGSIKQEDIPSGARLTLSYNYGKKVNCAVPNASLAVQANGKVVGCIDWLESYVVGDCRENTLCEIWRGDKAIEFRNVFKKGKLPSICEECGLYCPIDSAMKAVSLFKYKLSDRPYYIVRRGGL